MNCQWTTWMLNKIHEFWFILIAFMISWRNEICWHKTKNEKILYPTINNWKCRNSLHHINVPILYLGENFFHVFWHDITKWIWILDIPSEIALFCKMNIVFFWEWIISLSNKVDISKNSIISSLFVISLFDCILNVWRLIILRNICNILRNILKREDIFRSNFFPYICSMKKFIKYILFKLFRWRYHEFTRFCSENFIYCIERGCKHLTKSPCFMCERLFVLFSEFSWDIKDNWHSLKIKK